MGLKVPAGMTGVSHDAYRAIVAEPLGACLQRHQGGGGSRDDAMVRSRPVSQVEYGDLQLTT